MVRADKYIRFSQVTEGKGGGIVPHLSSIYDPFGSPHRGQMPLVEEGNRLTRCSDPLSYKVGGASKPSP